MSNYAREKLTNDRNTRWALIPADVLPDNKFDLGELRDLLTSFIQTARVIVRAMRSTQEKYELEIINGLNRDPKITVDRTKLPDLVKLATESADSAQRGAAFPMEIFKFMLKEEKDEYVRIVKIINVTKDNFHKASHPSAADSTDKSKPPEAFLPSFILEVESNLVIEANFVDLIELAINIRRRIIDRAGLIETQGVLQRDSHVLPTPMQSAGNDTNSKSKWEFGNDLQQTENSKSEKTDPSASRSAEIDWSGIAVSVRKNAELVLIQMCRSGATSENAKQSLRKLCGKLATKTVIKNAMKVLQGMGLVTKPQGGVGYYLTALGVAFCSALHQDDKVATKS